MLDRSGNSHSDVQLGTHQTAGLTDLIGVRTPAIVGDGARRPNSGVAEGRSEVLDQLEILGRLEPASAGDDHRRLGKIEFAAATLFRLDNLHPRGSRINRRLSV